MSGLDDAQFFFGYVLLTKLSFRILFLFNTGVTNLFAIGGHFVSYRWVSGPHNFLVIP